MNRDKELYRQLRALPWSDLWTKEVPRFNAASARERLERVATIRAASVVFAEKGPREQLPEIKTWLRALLTDPQEKIRRYAAAALPKLNATSEDEQALLDLTTRAANDREKKHLGSALGKIGGSQTLKHADALPPQTIQRIKAKLARAEQPSKIRLDAILQPNPSITIHLHCRSGLEQIVADEVSTFKKFQIQSTHRGLVILTATNRFTVTEILTLRCFSSLSFHVGCTTTDNIAGAATPPAALQLLTTLTEGPIRYRIDFPAKGHQRALVAKLAQQIHAAHPQLINGGGDTPWTLTIRGQHIEWTPKILPDPRFTYRRRDVPAASHPPLAASMARLSIVSTDPKSDEANIRNKDKNAVRSSLPSLPSVKLPKTENTTIWDPFCGSGVELIERALLGNIAKIIGTDLSAEAIEITRQNLAAANFKSIPTQLTAADFRQFDPGPVSLIITNPPMGRRVPIPNLRQLIADLFQVAARVLVPNGAIILANPVSYSPPTRDFHRAYSQQIDLGGFHVRLEKYLKR